ncbi:MAG: ABC transporter ATP-binding protein/permease [Defluviitaleaceae bacterium]|nr:ABC transporter ATP-binding protein/permease [Defluviitaleaceae bacterium]
MKSYWAPFSLGVILYSGQQFAFTFIASLLGAGIVRGILAMDISIVYDSVLQFAIMILAFMLIFAAGIYGMFMSVVKANRLLKRDLFRSFMRQSLESSHASHSGEGIAAINTEADAAAQIYDNPFAALLGQVISIIGFTIAVFITDWRIGIGVVVVGLIAFLAQNVFTKPLAKIGKEQLEENAKAVSSASNVLGGGLTIRAYNMQNKAFITFDKNSQKLKFLDMKTATISAFQGLFTTLQGWLTLLLTFGFGGFLVTQGHLDLSHLIFLQPMIAGAAAAFGAIGTAYAGMQPPLAAAERVLSRIDATPPLSISAGSPNKAEGYGLKINIPSFRYNESEKDNLQNIDLEIGENMMVAFVGESGSGKSTLLRNIIGMYERDNIDISLGNSKFDETDIRTWRKHFAYVDQTCKLFDMTISENIAMGAVSTGATPTQEDIEKAAKLASAHDFIVELPEGYNSPCGERGASLSGGQKQRIAIARALMKDAKVLVFDEATAALDAQNEGIIMDTINQLRQDHTILMTTHNLESVADADVIVVMDGGMVSEIRKK